MSIYLLTGKSTDTFDNMRLRLKSKYGISMVNTISAHSISESNGWLIKFFLHAAVLYQNSQGYLRRSIETKKLCYFLKRHIEMVRYIFLFLVVIVNLLFFLYFSCVAFVTD